MKNTGYDIAALGELLIDMTPDGAGEQGQPRYQANPGGAPPNLLAMASQLGSHCAFLGRVGQDVFGRMLHKTLTERGIDASGVSFDERIPTTLALVGLDETGERSFSFYRKPGADIMITAEGLRYDLIDAAPVFHFGTLSLTDEPAATATRAAVEYAVAHQKCVSFDPNIRRPLWDNLDSLRAAMEYGFSQCEVVKLSDEELEYFTGTQDLQEGAEKLAAQYPNIKLFFITLGSKGCLVGYKGQWVEQPGVVQPNVVDTTGAGDCFMGVCLHHIARLSLETLDWPTLKKMVTQANAAASIVITRKGALCSMPTPQEIQAVLDAQV